MPVCPLSVRLHKTISVPTGRILIKLDIWGFSKSVEKIQISLKFEEKQALYMKTFSHI
jgi:hypothetical protein